MNTELYIGYTLINEKRYYLTKNNSIIIIDKNAFYIDNCYFEKDNIKYLPLYYNNNFQKYTLLSYEEAINAIKEKEILFEINKLLNRFNNPFIKPLDNKRYYTFDCYSKRLYGKKIAKIPLDGPFNCPNRDGKISKNGCIFCYGGSNAFPDLNSRDIQKQFSSRKDIFLKKWPDSIFYAYFQSYSNTYADIEFLKNFYQPFIEDDNIKGIVIATRSDCLDKEKIQWLNNISTKKPIWLELGLQSIHDKTLQEMNRGHNYTDFLKIIEMLKDTNILISIHLINGWPTETREMMLESAIEVGKLPIDAIKFHMLHICKNTPLGELYLKDNFNLLSQEEYTSLVGKQITYLDPNIIIERLTGDSLKEQLLAPQWTIKKVNVINDIDKYMVANNYYQGLNRI